MFRKAGISIGGVAVFLFATSGVAQANGWADGDCNQGSGQCEFIAEDEQSAPSSTEQTQPDYSNSGNDGDSSDSGTTEESDDDYQNHLQCEDSSATCVEMTEEEFLECLADPNQEECKPTLTQIIDLGALSRTAKSRLTLPDVSLEVSPSTKQLVHLPTWLALDSTSWTSQSATASTGGVTVTAEAVPDSVEWNLGEGTVITCDGPGTKWVEGNGVDPASASPDCGHTYTKTTDGEYIDITVTVSWTVTWSATSGQSGTFTGMNSQATTQWQVVEYFTSITG